ncbi:hypothetical protein BT69DRAFT_1216083 [Atractiella rhizophila]|nr:hypothetical protein BT69DRAFT_1216083 [Atractiella rhizophila]
MAEEITVTVRAPSSVSFSITFPPSITVLELKEKIEVKSPEIERLGEVKKEQLRLIYSGRVLKDEDQVDSYGIKNGHTMHLVKGAVRSTAPSSSGSGTTNNVPRNIEVGQQWPGADNPLAPLLNASNTGYGPGLAGAMQQIANPFGGNLNDPNQMLGMMDSPEFRQQMDTMLQDPHFVDMMIQQGPPELRQMGPMLREMLRIPMYRQMLTDPNLMRQMQGMRGAMGGMGATNTTPAPSGTTPGLADQGLGQGQGQPDLASMMRMMQAMGGMQGMGMGGMGGGMFGAPPVQPTDTRPPEERFEVQLGQLREMGFTNASQNIRALMANGGDVQSAIEYMLGGGGL